jgi:AcrR family transcriptional regulator
MYHVVHRMQRKTRPDQEKILERCLAAFVKAGTIDLSLDQLASKVGISKRMLVHYFGGRENIEERAMTLLEERLRAQFSPEAFPSGASLETVLMALWKQTTAPQAKGVLLLVMDLSRRAWSGSARAKAFYAEQQRLWVQLLTNYLPDESRVEEVLQLFQGAVLAYLITGDPEPGERSLVRIVSAKRKLSGKRPSRQKARPRR